MRRLAALAALAAALSVAPSSPLGADAVGPDGQGWWNRAQQVPNFTVPAPPTVGPEDLHVAFDATGPAAISAVRIVLPSSVDATNIGGVLTLVVAPRSASKATAAKITACPAAKSWEPAQNGAWAKRPEADCATDRAPGVAAADGSSMVFDLGPGLATTPGVFDVVLVPEGPAPFSVTFARPGADSFEYEAPPVPESGDSGGAPAFSDESSPLAGSSPGSGFDPTFGATTDPLPAPPGELPRATTPEQGTATASNEAAAPPVSLPAAVPAGILGDDGRSDRIFAVAVLFVLLAAWWWAGGGQARAPRLLGPFGAEDRRLAPATVRVGPDKGIGRFARPRERPPRRLL